MLRLAVLALSLPLYLALAAPAQSATITYQLSGIVTAPDTAYAPTVSTGDAVNLTLVFDDALPDGNPNNSSVGFYQNSLLSFDLTAGSWSGSTPVNFFGIPVPGDLTVRDNVGGEDSVTIFSPVAGDTLTTDPVALFLDLVDPTATAVSGDGFPLLTAFDGGAGRVRFATGAPPQLEFSIDSITIVPEPSTALLLGLGLVALGGSRRRA